jgi:hypothetical protein
MSARVLGGTSREVTEAGMLGFAVLSLILI